MSGALALKLAMTSTERRCPKDFKQTELGFLPVNWSVVELQQICREAITYGIVQCGPHVANGVPYIRVSDMEGRTLDISKMLRTSHEIAGKFERSAVAEGDIVYALRGKLGEVRLIHKGLSGANLTQGTARISPNNSVSGEYLLWALRTPQLLQAADRDAKGTTFREITLADLRQLKVPLPPVHEQYTIAKALSDADTLVEALDQLLAKKRSVKQGAMQELLTGKRRLSQFKDAWIATQLGTIAHIKTGSRNNQDKSSDGQYPFFVRSETIERISTYGYNCEAILVPGEGGIGNIFHYINGKFDAHQRVYVISHFDKSVVGKFIHLFMCANFGRHAMQNSVKATVDSLRLPTFQTFEVRFPPTLVEQHEIASILCEMDAELEDLEAKLAKAKHVKSGMMQELLTGRIRLV